MKISVFGTGYVGLVTGACFAEMGNHVIGVDIDGQKIKQLKAGQCPIYEPGLEALLQRNLERGHLEFTLDALYAINHSDIIFIAVGTPSDEDGSADLRYVLEVAKTISQHMQNFKIIVNKSTVPVGTSDKVRDVINQQLKKRKTNIDFAVVSNPEFLKEGSAIDDCLRPDRIIIGAEHKEAISSMKRLYAPFNCNHDRIMVMDLRSAELAKYAANAMLATKISFMNEMSRIAEFFDADIEQIRLAIGADQRIGYHFIYAGAGYGGSCFPKDVLALRTTAKQVGYKADILAAVHEVNERQKQVLFEKIRHFFKGQLKGKTFALWGLAFKPNTDDIRDAPSRVLMEALFKAGAKVQAFDPQAMPTIKNAYPKEKNLILCESAEAALQGADALVVITEWHEFKQPDFNMLKSLLKHPLIFDGRNLYEPEHLKSLGFRYFGIGRGEQRDE
jgi:UDPglucose 6-dehydrogenase